MPRCYGGKGEVMEKKRKKFNYTITISGGKIYYHTAYSRKSAIKQVNDILPPGYAVVKCEKLEGELK
jgi:hypothetical protein